jgi:hypothetical protein
MKVVSSLALLSAVSTLQSTFAFSVNPSAISSAAKHQTSKLSHSAQRTASSALNMHHLLKKWQRLAWNAELEDASKKPLLRPKNAARLLLLPLSLPDTQVLKVRIGYLSDTNRDGTTD